MTCTKPLNKSDRSWVRILSQIYKSPKLKTFKTADVKKKFEKHYKTFLRRKTNQMNRQELRSWVRIQIT